MLRKFLIFVVVILLFSSGALADIGQNWNRGVAAAFRESDPEPGAFPAAAGRAWG